MENSFAKPPANRPDDVHRIINSLEVYDIEKTCPVLESYAIKQGVNDTLASAALLKQYQMNPRFIKDDIIITVLSKALLNFYTGDFTTLLHLLPPYVLLDKSARAGPDSLQSQTQKLVQLYDLLDSFKYTEFWQTYESHDSYADIVADVGSFEDDIRLSIALTVSISCKQIAVEVFQEWSNLSQRKFSEWVSDALKWEIKDGMVVIPPNKDNEAKIVVTSETVKFDQLSRVIRRAFEIRI